MPVYSRQTLRTRLGQNFLRDTYVGTTTGSHGATASLTIWDQNVSDPSASGEGLYTREWIRLCGSAGFIQDARIQSFNVASGAYHMMKLAATTIVSAAYYERHSLLEPIEKDRLIDMTIQQTPWRQELAIWASVDNHNFSLGPDVLNILDVRYFTDPLSTTDKGVGRVDGWQFAFTQTGQELRIRPSLQISQQLVIDAMVAVSLGAADLATVNLLSDELVLWGAAARAYWLLEQRAPAQEAQVYRSRREEAAKAFEALTARYQPRSSKKVELDDPY